jgi:hypothetical protein
MRRRFEFEVRAEYQQFLLYDLAANTVENHDWTCEAEERLLAVEEGIIGVGTISDGIVSVVLEIADSEPNEDMSRWDQVNEATIEVPSGRLIVAGILDHLRDARAIDLEPGSYRTRLYYGDLGSLINGIFSNEHYKLIMWRAAPGPLLVLKQASLRKKERIN